MDEGKLLRKRIEEETDLIPFLIISFQSTVASPNGVSGRYAKTLVEDL